MNFRSGTKFVSNIPKECGAVVGMTTIKGRINKKTGVRSDVVILACQYGIYKLTQSGMALIKIRRNKCK